MSRDIKFSVVERDAESLVSQSIYDENGVIIGQIPEEEYQEKLEDARGKTFFECLAVTDQDSPMDDNPEPVSVRFQSAVVEQELRAGAMAEMFAAFGSALFTGFFKR